MQRICTRWLCYFNQHQLMVVFNRFLTVLLRKIPTTFANVKQLKLCYFEKHSHWILKILWCVLCDLFPLPMLAAVTKQQLSPLYPPCLSSSLHKAQL